MKKKISTLFMLIISFVLGVHAPLASAVIYGGDDRLFVNKNTSNEFVKKYSSSILAKMRTDNAFVEKDGSFVVNTEDLSSRYNMCSENKYAEESSAADCSAFLVAPNIVATAAHCLKTLDDCKKSVWAFDYKTGGKQVKIKNSDVVKCTGIVATKSENQQDYTFFRISKTMIDRPVLEFMKNYDIDKSDEFLILGHPFGMPMVLTNNVKIKNKLNSFKVLLKSDTASGNSGSPVIEKKTGKVVGIFLSGDIDFTNANGVCNNETKCGLFNCHRGEHMQLAWPFPLHLLK